VADGFPEFQPICGSQRTFNQHQLPRREDVRIGSTKSPVTRTSQKKEMSFEETCLFAASGNAAQTASLMYVSRIPMPRAISRRTPAKVLEAHEKRKGGSTSSPVFAVISPRWSTDGLIGKKENLAEEAVLSWLKSGRSPSFGYASMLREHCHCPSYTPLLARLSYSTSQMSRDRRPQWEGNAGPVFTVITPRLQSSLNCHFAERSRSNFHLRFAIRLHKRLAALREPCNWPENWRQRPGHEGFGGTRSKILNIATI
jgi:hypothetical protein